MKKVETQLVESFVDVVGLLDKTKSPEYNKGVSDAIQVLIQKPLIAEQIKHELLYAKAKNFVMENFRI